MFTYFEWQSSRGSNNQFLLKFLYIITIRLFRTKSVISHDRARFARAWNREFGNYGDRGGGLPEEAFLKLGSKW